MGQFKSETATWLKRVSDENRSIVITQNGRAAAVVICPQEFDRMRYRKPAVFPLLEPSLGQPVVTHTELAEHVFVLGNQPGTRRRRRIALVEIMIRWHHDDPFDVDPSDCLGAVAILGQVGRLEDTCVNLDTVFYGLLRLLQSLRSETPAEIDLVEEPDLLRGERSDHGVTLLYGQQSVELHSMEEFERALRTSVAEFLDSLPSEPPDWDTYAELRRFVGREDSE